MPGLSDIFSGIGNFFKKKDESGNDVMDWAKLLKYGGGLAGLYGLTRIDDSSKLSSFFGGGPRQPVGYQGEIPRYTAQRTQLPQTPDPNRRPGSAGRRYFTDVQYTPKVTAAAGGLMSFPAQRQGYYLGGPTDGMADRVPANIDGRQEAALSHGEFVMPADVVSHLGNGNSEAGAQVLYDIMAKVRQARTGTPQQGKQINPYEFFPRGNQ